MEVPSSYSARTITTRSRAKPAPRTSHDAGLHATVADLSLAPQRPRSPGGRAARAARAPV